MYWNPEVLTRIDAADDLKIAPYHPDMNTTGTPTWIWEVKVDNRLFVRANDLTDSKTLAHLLKYDSLLGKLDAEVTAGEGGLLLMVNPLPYSVNATRPVFRGVSVKSTSLLRLQDYSRTVKRLLYISTAVAPSA